MLYTLLHSDLCITQYLRTVWDRKFRSCDRLFLTQLYLHRVQSNFKWNLIQTEHSADMHMNSLGKLGVVL